MKQISYTIPVVILASLSSLSCKRPQKDVPPPQTVPIAARLASLDDLSEKGKLNLLDDLEKEKGNLENSVREKLESDNTTTVAFTMYFIGERHLTNLAGDLSDRIKFQDNTQYMSGSSMWYWDNHPAVGALVRLGFPSVQYMTDNLAKQDDKEIRELSIYVLTRCSAHEDRNLARFFINRAMREEGDPIKKKRLARALPQVEAIEVARKKRSIELGNKE
jgi:hypothetical protein